MRSVSPFVIFAIFCSKCFLVFPVLGLFWALRPSRMAPWNEEESFSQKIAKITKTIPWMESQRLESPFHKRNGRSASG
jgi:hypothetical protein